MHCPSGLLLVPVTPKHKRMPQGYGKFTRAGFVQLILEPCEALMNDSRRVPSAPAATISKRAPDEAQRNLVR
jgi:hypothetical protein